MSRSTKVDVDLLTKSTNPMKNCCKMLGIHMGSYVHRNIVGHMIKLTAYHKPHVNKKGTIRVRDNGILTDTFKSLVTELLTDRKVGSLYFPQEPSADNDFRESYLDLDHRLVFNHPGDTTRIWAGIALMMEQVEAHAEYASPEFLGELHEVLETLDGDDCEKCGSEESDALANRILFCSHCHMGYHTQCKSMLADNDRWFCGEKCRLRCLSNTREWLGATLKFRKRLKRPADSDLGRQERPATPNMTRSGAAADVSSNTSMPAVGISTAAHEPVSDTKEKPKDLDIVDGTRSLDRRTYTQQDAAQHNNKTAESIPPTHKSGVQNAATSTATSTMSGSLQSSSHTKSPSQPTTTPSATSATKSASLQQQEISNTVLYTRLKDEAKVFRKLSFDDVRCADSLFKQTAALWSAKVPGFEVDRILVHDDEIGGYVEMANSDADFQELVHFIRRGWDQRIYDKSIFVVKLTLLQRGEVVSSG